MKCGREDVFHRASASLYSPYSTQCKSSFTKVDLFEESLLKKKLENKDARHVAQNLYLSQTFPLLHLTTVLCFTEDNASQSVSSLSWLLKGDTTLGNR